jgi:hypothetical protein
MVWSLRPPPSANACLLCRFSTISLALFTYLEFVRPARAHVKWFCAYDVSEQPDGLHIVLCPNFFLLIGVSVVALLAGALLEGTTAGDIILHALDRVTRYLRENIDTIFRASCAFFFIAIWGAGGILLTPELKTDSAVIGAIQLGIAASMLSRRTTPLGGLGIVILYAVAIWKYGIFHLADYPVFLAVAAYLILVGTQHKFFGARPIDVLRWGAGITLMWASIEKWAYPDWTYPLLILRPEMTFGFTPEFYMRAAGAVEFALAFALIWSPLVRRIAAIILAEMFVSAVIPFGKIDLIGHTLIVVALLGIIADDIGKPARLHRSLLLPVSFASALALTLAVYYVGHALLFGTVII